MFIISKSRLKIATQFIAMLYRLSCRSKMPYNNVLALGAVADFGAQNCQYATKVDAW
jgi:Flp pilus assembly protein protease CpaA